MAARHPIRDKSLNKKENNSNENVDKFLKEINLSNLLTEQHQKAVDLITEMSDVFCQDSDDIGDAQICRIKIRLKDEIPVQKSKTFRNVNNSNNSPPLLSYPNFDQPLILHVGASTKGLGTGLYQHKDKKVRILGYGSRALAKAEQKYHISKLEFVSLKWDVCEQFWNYLTYAKQIQLYTENNP